jgi:hypothetical protein
MPTYIPVYQRKLDPETGRPILEPNGLEVMELVKIIEIPDEPIYDSTPDGNDYSQNQNISPGIVDFPITEDPIENP